jgi:cell division septation protein DedD
MEAPLKQRLIGAVVLAALALIFVPMLLKSPDVRDPDRAEVPLVAPAEPDADGIKTIDIPLDASQPAAPMAEASADGAQSMTDEVLSDTQANVPASAASEEAMPAADTYALIIPAATDAEAQALLPALKNLGLTGKIQSNGKAYRVRVAPFASRELAESARLRAKAVSANGVVVAQSADANASAPIAPVIPAVVTAPNAAATTGTAAIKTTPVQTPAAPVATPAVKPAVVKVPEAKASEVKPAGAKAFAVQIGAPASEAAANSLREQARAAGFASYIQAVDTESGRRYRVRIGPEADRAAAANLLAQVKQKTGIDGIIVQHP